MFCSQSLLTRTFLLPVLCMSKHKCKYPASLPSAAVAAAAVAGLSTTSTPIDLLATSPIKRRKLSPPSIPSPSPLTSHNFSTMPTIRPTITLTPDEENLRRLLVDCAAHIDSTNPNPSGPHIQNAADTPLVLRFTGGWVRDKLLQGQSSDIDVGINKMTGYEFGKHLATFIAENGPKYGIESGPRGVHKIESNPEKSKHLETATTRILGLEIDLVNLRSEAYSEDSRIPITMEFGTPKQDALRRDATVNALFYNLHTGEVEDFTERGLEDLEKGLMRTPLKPWETFRDDPLRVLRLIRFASRLGFEIVDEVKEAMRDEEIKRSLRVKISRERVGAEVEKMLKGKDPYLSLYLIHTLSLTPAIFCPPVDPVPDIPWGDILPAINALKFIFFTMPQQFLANAFSTPQERYIAWINAAVIPWRGLFEGTGHKQVPSAAVAAREGLKTRNKDTDILIATYKNWDDIVNMLNLNEEKDGGLNTVEAGKAVRRWGASWTTQILGVGVGKLVDVWGENPEPSMDARELVKKYDRLVGRIKELGLEEAYNLKPVLNGKQLCKLLDRKPGTWMKNALEKVVDWQLEHPEKEEQEAKEFVLAIAGDLD